MGGMTAPCLLQSNQNTSFIWPESDSRVHWGVFCVSNLEFSRSRNQLCPIKTDLAEVSVTRDKVAIIVVQD